MIRSFGIVEALSASTPKTRAIIYMIVGGFSFAAMGAMTHGLGKYFDWGLIAFYRMLFSFFITFAWAVSSGKKPFVLGRKLLWFRCFVGSTGMLATFYALTRLPVSDVSVITELRPLWVALAGGIILGEKNPRYLWLSIVAGLVGVVLIEKPHIGERNFAVFIALLASFIGAVVMLCLRKLRDLDPRTIVTQFTATATVVSLLTVYFFGDISEALRITEPSVFLMIIGIGVFGTLGQLTMTRAFALGEASTVSTAGLIKVGFSAGFDVLIWGYVFHYSTIAGMVLILASTSWLFRRPKVSSPD